MKKRCYCHLSIEERDQIAVFKGKGFSIRAIAKELGRDSATICRELRRNAPPLHMGYYLAHKAHERAKIRWEASVQRTRLKSPWLRTYVRRHIKRGWSPELISGRLKRLKHRDTISHEAIYQWVYASAQDLIPYLVRRHRIRRPRGYSRKHQKAHIPERTPITERPNEVGQRRRFGHWEADTIVSKQSLAVLQIVVERKARYSLLNKLPDKKASSMRKTLNRSLSHWPAYLRRSITYDNGSENVEHQRVNATLGTQSYFCHPYTSQEKGTVENTAGLVRRFFPKKTNFAILTKNEVKRVERWLNSRPRKCLDYFTPTEALRMGVALRG